MRCGRHPYEGGVGVCALCLRDRLLALAAAQNEASSLPPSEPEPELVFPRSVSPYVCRRKSDASGARWRPPGLLFFRTPQVGPAYAGGAGGAGFEEDDIGFQRRRSSRFSLVAALFGGHHSHGSDSGEKSGGKGSKHRSWLAGIMPRGRRKKEPVTTSPPSPPRRSCRAISNRGLSPVRYADEGGVESTSPAESPWLPSPSSMRKTPCRRRPGGAGAGVSGFAVCISPLVRPSPGRHHRRGHPPDAPAVSAELRPSPLHRLTSGTSLPHCRSWKLADGGRFR
ncbi:uncharacterized protein LOC133924861 [Phragmites australis]|uniref:uncharacterized protein LOC133924861 n=1 Tax=Phragmites australis TaxID=29695 RepID=UPI002D79AB7A|nr:uncharacterized protein LOC133924861 [Phragmites australis]